MVGMRLPPRIVLSSNLKSALFVWWKIEYASEVFQNDDLLGLCKHSLNLPCAFMLNLERENEKKKYFHRAKSKSNTVSDSNSNQSPPQEHPLGPEAKMKKKKTETEERQQLMLEES